MNLELYYFQPTNTHLSSFPHVNSGITHLSLIILARFMCQLVLVSLDNMHAEYTLLEVLTYL